jgi:site-specific DNA-adenine methylase
MRYPGGKFRCFQKLINLIPPHRVYIETHLGGGAVLRNKAPAGINIGVDRDPFVIARIVGQFGKGYQFFTQPAEEFLEAYCFEGDEFVYADPPYWPASRRSARSPYRYRYTEAEHLGLLRILRGLPCAVMISGYASAAYDRALEGWNRRLFVGTSHVGVREEIVWLNYEPGLVHDSRYLGHTFRERQAIKRKRARWSARFSREPVGVQQALLSDLLSAFRRGWNGRVAV